MFKYWFNLFISESIKQCIEVYNLKKKLSNISSQIKNLQQQNEPLLKL